jgi:hypothetical protein
MLNEPPNPTEAAEGGPVTVSVRRRIKPGQEAEFEAWMHGVIQAASQFPGHLGANILRPVKPSREYVLIFRFAQYAQLRAWEESAERERWLAQVRPLTEGETEVQRVSGMEFWFTPPTGAAPVPPRWKMALVTISVIWPLSTCITNLLGPLLNTIPILLRGLVVALIMVPLMTYIVMPWATRLYAKWLFPKNG